MNTFIALFRGINVGGRHLMPMKELVDVLESCGCEAVTTYIQSGNAVLQASRRPGAAVTDRIEERFDFRPEMWVFSVAEFRQFARDNPFPGAEGKTCHFAFCREEPTSVDTQRLEHLKSGSERYARVGRVFYLHAPDGIGRSKLAAQVERCLGVSVTVRNLNTVNRLLEIATVIDGR